MLDSDEGGATLGVMQDGNQQYTHRILGYLKSKDALGTLNAAPRQTDERAPGAPMRKKLRFGKWSVSEILRHLSNR